MSELIKVLVYSNGEKKITEIKNHFKEFQNLVDGYFEVSYLSKKLSEQGICIYINEEGKLLDLEPSILIVKDNQLLDYLVGTCVFTAYDGNGETISLSEEQILFLEQNVFNRIAVINFDDRQKTYQLPCIEF